MPDRETETVRVWIPASLSWTGKGRWADKAVDVEIASIVRALTGRVITVSSCSGHGRWCGRIALLDGRHLLVVEPEGDYDVRPIRWHLREVWRHVTHAFRWRFWLLYELWVLHPIACSAGETGE